MASVNQSLDPFRLAAGLLRNDRWLLAPLVLLLAVPTLLDLFYPFPAQLSERAVTVYVSIVDRVLHLVVVGFIVLRWRRKLESPQGVRVSRIRAMWRMVLVGTCSYMFVAVPLFAMALSQDAQELIVWVMLLAMGCWYSLRIYFYFVAASVFGMGIIPSVRASIELTKADRTAAVRSLVTPVGISLILVALCMAPAPDGRSLGALGAASIAEEVFWILSCYTGLAFGLLLFDDAAWKAAGLNPYRAERLATLHTQGGTQGAKFLSFRSGVMLLGVSICLLIANLLRQLHDPPAAQITIDKVTVADYSIRVEIVAQDSQYQFRGFTPAAFSIASKTGLSQSPRLISATDVADKKEIKGSLLFGGQQAKKLYLSFESNKTAANLRAQDNLWLWYKLNPLMPIRME